MVSSSRAFFRKIDPARFADRIGPQKKNAVVSLQLFPAAREAAARKGVSDQTSQIHGPAGLSRLQALLLFCGAAAPVLYVVFLVLRYAVPIPMLDDWEMVPLITKAREGNLSFADLFEQQQEARTFFPKLLFILCALGKYWDGRIEMMLSVLFCCLTSLGLYFLLGQSGLSRAGKATAFLLMVLLIFTPAQHELWVLASGMPSFIPALCIVAGLVVTQTGLSTAAKFWLCVALAFFSGFSLSHGLLAWGLTFPVLFATRAVRHWKRWLGFWLLACTACVAAYFWDFRAQPDLPAFAPRKSVVEYIQYVAAFLGSGLGRSGNENPLAVSTAVGLVLLFGYFAAAAFAFRFRDREFLSRILPWMALGAYSIGSAILAALGRIQWGVAQALESRYVPFSLYLAVALIALTAIFLSEFRKRCSSARLQLAIFAVTSLLFATCLTLELLCAVASVPFFRLRSAAARLGHGAVLFSQVLDTSDTIRNVNFPRPHFVRQNADALDRLGLLRTPLLRAREISKLRHSETSDGGATGWFDVLNLPARGQASASGWAALPGKGRPADCVVLAYADAQGDWIVFALSDAVLTRPDVVEVLHTGEQLWSGWRVGFSRDAVPQGAKISAWAVDAKGAKLYRLKEVPTATSR